MKILTPATADKASTTVGTTPIVIVKINYPGGVKYYADQDYTFGADICEGKIISLSDITSARRVDNLGEVSSCNIVLDDSDGAVKTLMDTVNLVNIDATVYLHYTDLPATDATVLFKGIVAGDISWDETLRQVGYTLESLPDKNVGITTIAGDALPLCYGTPLKVPAKLINGFGTGGVAGQWHSSTATIKLGQNTLPQNTLITIDVMVSNEPLIDASYGFMQTFSNDSPVRCTGTLVGDTFTFASKNLPLTGGISIDARVSGDEDYANPQVLWIASDLRIEGTWVNFNNHVNYCARQEGRKCFFRKPLLAGYTTITETAGIIRASWGHTYVNPGNGWTAPIDDFTIWNESGVRQIVGLQQYIYCFNTIPSSAVLKVYCQRQFKGETILAEVPSSYYVKDLAYNYNGATVAALKFDVPLHWRNGENWAEDKIYVTHVSSVGKNTVDQIQHIVENYTAYTVDATSFAAVKAIVTNYPSSFAILDKRPALEVLQSICMQARIGLNIDGDTVRLRYLSQEPVIDLYSLDSNLKLNTLTLGYQRQEDLATRVKATWRRDYHSDALEYVYENNVSIYGVKEAAYEFSIYNIESLVALTTRFIGYRKSNIWRKAKLKTFLDFLGVEIDDCVAIYLEANAPTAIRAAVDSVLFNSVDYVYEMGFTLACKGGTNVYDASYYTSYPPIGGEAMPTPPEAGLSETDFVVPRDPTKQDTNQFNGQEIKIEIVDADDKNIDYLTRDYPATIKVEWLDNGNNRVMQNAICSVQLSAGDDTITPTTITLVNGYYTGDVTVTGGAGLVNKNLRIGFGTTSSGLYGTKKIEIRPEPTPKFNILTAVERGAKVGYFIDNCLPTTTYQIELQNSYDTDVLYDGSDVAVTEFTTDATGAFTATDWVIKDGALSVTDTQLKVSHLGYEYLSPKIIVLDMASPGAIVYEVNSVLTEGTAVSSPSWAPATSTDETIGLVAKVIAGKSYVVVRGFCCIAGYTPDTKYYVTAGGAVDTVDTGAFVFKSYLDDFIWVGGGSDAGMLDKLKDVTITSVSDKDILVFDTPTTKWKNRQLATVTDADRLVVTDAIRDKAVTFAKIQEVLPYTVMGNFGAVNSTPLSITASAVGQVLMYKDAVLQWSTISNANISPTAAISYTKIDFTGWSGAATPNSLTAGTGLTGSSFNGSTAQTWSVNFGSSPGTVCAGNDARLSDARTPTAHSIVSHTLSGATAGQVMLATSSTGYGFITMSGDATIDATGVFTIGANKVTVDKIQQVAANSILANVTGSTADLDVLTAGAGTVLRRGSSGNLGFSALAASDLGTGAAADYVLKYNGSAMVWSAASVTLAGDVSGASGANTVNKIKGIPVNSSGISLDANYNDSPITYYHTGAGGLPEFEVGGIIGLKFGGTGVSGAGVTDPNKFFAYPSTGTGDASFRSILAVDLASGGSDGQVLTKSGTGFAWTTVSGGGGTLAGDVSGSIGANTVDKIKGITVNTAAITPSDTFGARLAFYNEDSDTIIFSDKIGAGTNGANGALLTAYSLGPSAFAIGEIAPVASDETGYVLGIDTDLSVASAKPKWLRSVKLGKGEGAASASTGSLLIVTSTTGSHVTIGSSGITIKKAAETTAKVAISEDGIMALGNSGTGVGASLQVFNKTTGNYRLEMGASNFRKINANGTFTALTVETFTTTPGVPTDPGELGDVYIVY